jgi:hypothetical protein
MHPLVNEIRSCEYLYLDALMEPGVNENRIVLVEGMAGPRIGADELASEPDPVLRSLLVGSRKILRQPDSRRFELTWATYIGYSVVNESYSQDAPVIRKILPA